MGFKVRHTKWWWPWGYALGLLFGYFGCHLQTTGAKEFTLAWLIPLLLLFTSKCALSEKILVFGSFAYIFKTTSANELQLGWMILQGFLFTSKCVLSEKRLLFGSFAYILKTTSANELQLDWLISQDFLFTSKWVLPEKYFYLALLLTFSKPLVPWNCNLTEWFLRASCSHPSAFSHKNSHLAP